MQEKRSVNADLLRLLAAFMVNAVHFLLNNGFYYTPVEGVRMTVMVGMRSFFIVCVPLFLLLTGYLMKNKRLTKSYYKGILHTAVIYLLASAACAVYTILFIEVKPVSQLLLGTLNFTTAPYGWYVEMYIGLYLLIPFLNLIYDNLPSKKSRGILLLTLFVLSSLPALLNVYRFEDAAWWTAPYTNMGFEPLLPKFWLGLYPFLYYYLGAYLRDYPLRLRQWMKWRLIAGITGLSTAYNLWRSAPGIFIWGAWNDWASPFNVAIAVLLFSSVMQINTERTPKTVRKTLSVLSRLTLGAYLVSFVFDHLYYYLLQLKVPVVTERLKYFPVIVPAVFVSSMLLSGLLELLYKSVSVPYQRRRRRKAEAISLEPEETNNP